MIKDFIEKEFDAKTRKGLIGFVITPKLTISFIYENKKSKFKLEDMQREVGGLIELVYHPQETNYDIIVDEEGLLKNKELNMFAYGFLKLELVGNILFLKKGILK
jgi:hypothetical protein